MNGGSHYTGWFNNSHINYGDYIQGKEFERSIRYGINDQTKQIIASNEQLSRENYKVLEQINEGISSGFTTLSTDIAALHDSIDSGFQHIASIFEWGFSEVLVSLGRVNDSLDALIKIAKTPAQTWAYEQFEIARDEFRRGLYDESLESVLRAITGYGSNPGYKTEFRFHFLQGTIRLGSYRNSSQQIVDTSEAEAAFLRAARYASNDLPAEAARSLLCAGRAAFTQRKNDVALKHSTDAIALDGRLVEAYFQAAQVYCALGRPKDAIEHLVTAIFYDHNYSIKAASDGDICQYPEMLKDALILAKT
jgi:tetratricopeptide (TPR) repeat protein